MLAQIVVLYMTYLFNLPTWCNVLMWIAVVATWVKFMCGLYNAGVKQGETE